MGKRCEYLEFETVFTYMYFLALVSYAREKKKKLVSSDSLENTTPCYVYVPMRYLVRKHRKAMKTPIRFDAYFPPKKKCDVQSSQSSHKLSSHGGPSKLLIGGSVS